jgi:glycosidase
MKHVEAFLRAGLVLLFFMLALPIAQANEEIPAEWYGTQPDVYALYSRDTAGDNSYAFTPSPEQWRDRNIYQLFTDRFATDGVDRLAGYKPAWTCDGKPYPYNRNYHHGGNWNGLRQKLDYLEGMGITALWISGVQQNDQGKDPNYTPYHQYHAENFFKCDPAMGTFADLKNLIDDCHSRGMYVILDVAPNHMCDKNGINTGNENDDKAYWPDGHGSFGWWNSGNKHWPPFDNLDYFHNHGTINCWDCFPEQLLGQFKGTDDLRSDNPQVRSILAKAFKNLIDATDCDGFRVDAIKHVPYDWCRDWAQDIRNHAAWRGKNNFLMFGELFSYDNGALASWCSDGYGFNSALQFPMMQAMKNVFGNGYSSHQLGQEMGNLNMYGAGKDNVIAFLDNHDVDRFACSYGGGDAATAKAIMSPAMTFLYMAPPVPLLFYGTEHMFNQGGHYNGSNRTWDNPDDGDWQRECMFDKGFQPGNASGDMFSQWAKDRGLYGHIAWLNGLRNQSRALRRGGFEQRRASGGQGIYAFTKWYDQEVALVIVNTADYEMSLGDIWAGKGNAEFKENGVGPASFTSEGDGKIAFGSTKIGGKGTKIYICNFVDNSADVFGGGGTPSGLWARGTYGYPTESATTADTIYINTEAGPASLTDKKVYLIYGFNHPTGNWPKVEMNINTNWASTGGAWYHYSLGNLSTGQLDYVICVEHIADGVTNTFWDNNGGGNYTMTIYPAPEPANFSFQSVSANPVNPEPESSTTITVILRTAPETDISALAARVGYDIYDPATGPADVWPTYPMTRTGVVTNNATNVLSTFTYVVDSGLTNGYVMKYYIAASNGASVLYANNNGDNYSVVVQDWPAVPADVVITTPDSTTQAAEATVTGTAGANLIGPLFWTNALSGETGTFPLSGYWSVPVPLRVGINAVTIYGYEAGNVATTAQDRAANYATWSEGDNKGTGFGAWDFNHTQDGTTSWAGVFVGDPASAGITGFGDKTFGFYANPPGSGANAEVLRSFSSAMPVGATFSFDWGVNWDSYTVGSYRGFSLLAGDTELVYINMSNSATIQINGNPMFVNYGTQAMPLSFEYVANGSIRVRGTGRDGTESYDQTLSVPAGAPSKMKFYFNASSVPEAPNQAYRQMYVDNFKITSEAPGAKKQDSVTITREDDGNPRIECAGTRSVTLGDAGTAFDLDFSLANATAASWSAALTTLNGSHVQSWSGVTGATWDWYWTAYAAGSWRLRVTAHNAGGNPITNATVVLTASESNTYTLGTAWHCPTNREPYEDKYMRHPVQPGEGDTIEIYVGNYHPHGDMTGGSLVYRYGTNGAWSSSALAWATNTNDDNNRFFVGTQIVPGGQAGGVFQYYLKVEYTNGTAPVTTYVAMNPEQSAMYKLFKREGAAQATPFEVGIKGADGAEPGYIWHGGDITAAGAASVQIGAKIGYIKNGVKWADEAIVRYRVRLEDEGVRQVRGVTRIKKASATPGKRSWNALTNQVSMVYDGEVADPSPNGNAMRWVVNLTDTNLMNERAVLVYEIYARGANGVWRQAEYNAGGGASTFEFRLWSDGSGDLQVRGATRDYDSGWMAADYTTTKYFIDEADPSDTVTLQVRYNAPANAQKVELFTNVGRRDHADDDMNGDGWPDGIVPPDGNSVTAENTYNVGAGYWQAIPMTLGAGGWEKTLTVNKCGAYRVSARFMAAGETNGNWTWYSEGPEGAVRRDHAVVISPRKALEQTMYELNVFTIKATNTAQTGRGTFEKLSEKLLGGGDFDEFSLEYLNKLNVNCLWFQPIHPSGGERVENDPATGQRYWPGSPYGTKNYFSVNPDMANDPSEANAVAAFTNFVRLCDRARGETMDPGARSLNTINVMLDGVMNHTSWDAVYGAGLALATNGLGAAAIAELTNAYGNIAALQPESRIATTGQMGINWYSRATNYAMPATTYVSATDNDIGVAPERVDFGKWDDVAELLYGNYSTLIRFDDRTEAQKQIGELTEETSRMYNEDDQYYYDQMLPATKLLWKYMASYPEYWIKKTGHNGVNQPGVTDGNGVLLDDYGIDGLRCDYAQGLPSHFWEYLINRTRSVKWNFLFMAESLDGGLIGKRSNRHFDILNENMVFRFTQEKISEPAPLQIALEERRTLYGNGVILLNLTCHDEPMPFGDPWATASRYAMLSAIDGVPMIFYGQEHAVSPYEGEGDEANKWKGFYFFEQNFGKWIPHFKKWNQMYVWDDPCYPTGDFRDSRAMAQFYARVNQARLASPALRSKNRWFLNDNPRMMTVAKWEEEGANPNIRDSVIASVLFMNETGDTSGLTGNAQVYDLSPFADKLGLENRADRFYNVRNLAAANTNALLWPEGKAGSEIITNFYIGLNGGVDNGETSPGMVWADGAVVQYLQFVDVTAYPAPVFQVGSIPTNKEAGDAVAISVTATGDGEPVVTLTNAPAAFVSTYENGMLAFTPSNDGTFTFHFLAQNQRNDAFATTNFSVTILPGSGGGTQEVAIVALNNVTTSNGLFRFDATLTDLPSSITSLPVYTATTVTNGNWNWSLATNVPVAAGTSHVELPVADKCVISLGKPPILD